jgi:hypothetical protein
MSQPANTVGLYNKNGISSEKTVNEFPCNQNRRLLPPGCSYFPDRGAEWGSKLQNKWSLTGETYCCHTAEGDFLPPPGPNPPIRWYQDISCICCDFEHSHLNHWDQWELEISCISVVILYIPTNPLVQWEDIVHLSCDFSIPTNSTGSVRIKISCI